MVLTLGFFLFGCSEQEFRDKYEDEIRQEVKDVVKESVKEVLISMETIQITKPQNFVGSCTFTNLKCIDFIVNQNSLTLQLENNQEFDLIVKDFLVSDCTKATSNPKIGNYQMFEFAGCNNGVPGSTFDKELVLLIDGKEEKGHIKSLVFE